MKVYIMKINRTIKLKLNIKHTDILPTLNAYTKAFNYICEYGWNHNSFNSIELHKITYKYCRTFLPSQLSISARMKASESLKPCLDKRKKHRKVSKPISKQCSIRYDANSFNVWFNKKIISISTINGRIKIPFNLPEYFEQYITWHRCSAELLIRNKKVFMNIVFSKDIEDIKTSDNPEIIGVDRGINNIAVTSNNKFYTGANIKRIVNKTRKLRTALQKKKTKSSKRHLRKINSRENRFKANINHIISKKIVNDVSNGGIIVLEDLKYIRENIRLRKDQRRNLHNWSFYQLEQFIKYKAENKNIKVDYVDARYTSQKCSKCGYIHKSNRKSILFKCKKCNYSLNADLNASINISKNYADAKCYLQGLPINQPIVNYAKSSLQI